MTDFFCWLKICLKVSLSLSLSLSIYIYIYIYISPSLSLSSTPLTPCHTKQTARPPHTPHTHTEKRREFRVWSNAWFLFFSLLSIEICKGMKQTILHQNDFYPICKKNWSFWELHFKDIRKFLLSFFTLILINHYFNTVQAIHKPFAV